MADVVNKDVGIDVEAAPENQYTHTNSSRIDEGDFVTQTEERDLARGLHQRHVSLIAIAGAIVCMTMHHLPPEHN